MNEIQDTLEEISFTAQRTSELLANLFDSDLIDCKKRMNVTSLFEMILDIVIDREEKIKSLADKAVEKLLKAN